MKKIIAILVAATFAMGTAFAQSADPITPAASASHHVVKKHKKAHAKKKHHKKAHAKKVAAQ